MIQEIDVDGLVKLTNPVFVDVRSESEFAEATIPGAVNLPIFADAERAQVGTAYRQVSPLAAKDLGLAIVAPKLPRLVKQCRELGTKGELVIFCWRGGMRSRAVASIIDLMGIKVYRLQGGYKAYRRSIVTYWEQPELPFDVVVLRGNTGTGKTQLIQALREHGLPAVDLENLANNRGSVFGAVGLGAAPSQKQFEACLREEIRAFGPVKYVVVECESKRIGRVVLPEVLHKGMQSGKQLLVYDSVPNRVRRLVKEYTAFLTSDPELEAALSRLDKRLGYAKTDELKTKLSNGEYAEFTRILLQEYYDPLYGYPNQPDAAYSLSVAMEQPAQALEIIEDFLGSLEEGNGAILS